MAIKLVVFDMAGTTVEDHQNVAKGLQGALSAFGYEVSLEDANLVMGYPKPVAIRGLLQQYAGDAIAADNELVAKIHERFVSEIIRHYEEGEGISEKQGAGEVFLHLRNMGIKVALDTGFSRDIADAILRRLNWEKGVHYDSSITSDEVANGRPFPDMILRAMDLLQIDSADEVAKVGDTHSDLQEGNAAGCRYVIGITTGAYSESELNKEKHTHLVKTLDEIIDIVSEEEMAVY
ncbi:HAD family hydrolase [Taibaiella soli]|uniref:Phosphonoacetaldehyde hydrolase n=1 Tax=Taibaiella soli TaxID=1649169 RepID=A0A2W2B766_9BACT|nr:HAD family hydrolase [Taibaiella soli]PZF71857.1 phosphonoacetaldehyde hydrolase [Taibaiella soli]